MKFPGLEDVQSGFPPDEETRLSSENWHLNPFLRWTMMNRSRILRTTPIWRGFGATAEFAEAETPLDANALDNGKPGSFAARLERLEIDGLIILHRGRVVCEKYLHNMRLETQHHAASISKSYIGVLAAILEEAKVLDPQKTAEFYVPEMTGTAMGDATLEQLMDMRAGICRPVLPWRSSKVGERDGGVFEAIGLMPQKPGSYRNLYEYMLEKPRDGAHGQAFFYDNGAAEAMGWVIKSVTGATLADLMSEHVFQPLGAQRDGLYVVDSTGAEYASGGLALTLRDLARLGEALRCDGYWNDRQIVPKAFVDDLRRGGDQALFANSRFVAAMPGGSYRRHFYTLHDEFDTFAALGRSGQRLYISPKAEVVVAHFAASPGVSDIPYETLYADFHRDISALFC